MNQIIDHFQPLNKWRIDHKKLWLEYLNTGNLPFSPKELHKIIHEIVDIPENRPRGKKLLQLRKKLNFTLKTNKHPYRPEEALERFVIASNNDNFFNQVPVGGGKESIDIVIRLERGYFEFVELKSWRSDDSPLYALVEGLKNLMEYRNIFERKIQQLDDLWDVKISILAPEEYYRNYLLMDHSHIGITDNLQRLGYLLQELGKEFDASLTFYSFDLTEKSFIGACEDVYGQQGLQGQDIATITANDKISLLERQKWETLLRAEV